MSNTKQRLIIKSPEDFGNEIGKGLVQYGKVKVAGLGIFETREIPARLGRNPQTGKIIMIPQYRKIKFRPTASLKKLVC